MPIRATCSCGKRLQAKDDLAGKRVKCPACGQSLVLSQQTPSPQEPALPLAGAGIRAPEQIWAEAVSGGVSPAQIADANQVLVFHGLPQVSVAQSEQVEVQLPVNSVNRKRLLPNLQRAAWDKGFSALYGVVTRKENHTLNASAFAVRLEKSDYQREKARSALIKLSRTLRILAIVALVFGFSLSAPCMVMSEGRLDLEKGVSLHVAPVWRPVLRVVGLCLAFLLMPLCAFALYQPRTLLLGVLGIAAQAIGALLMLLGVLIFFLSTTIGTPSSEQFATVLGFRLMAVLAPTVLIVCGAWAFRQLREFGWVISQAPEILGEPKLLLNWKDPPVPAIAATNNAAVDLRNATLMPIKCRSCSNRAAPIRYFQCWLQAVLLGFLFFLYFFPGYSYWRAKRNRYLCASCWKPVPREQLRYHSPEGVT